MDCPVHPEDKVAEIGVEIIGDIIGSECAMARDPVKADQERRCILPYHPAGFPRRRGVRRAAKMLPVALAPVAALEPYPFCYDDISRIDLLRMGAPLSGERDEFFYFTGTVLHTGYLHAEDARPDR